MHQPFKNLQNIFIANCNSVENIILRVKHIFPRTFMAENEEKELCFNQTRRASTAHGFLEARERMPRRLCVPAPETSPRDGNVINGATRRLRGMGHAVRALYPRGGSAHIAYAATKRRVGTHRRSHSEHDLVVVCSADANPRSASLGILRVLCARF